MRFFSLLPCVTDSVTCTNTRSSLALVAFGKVREGKGREGVIYLGKVSTCFTVLLCTLGRIDTLHIGIRLCCLLSQAGQVK